MKVSRDDRENLARGGPARTLPPNRGVCAADRHRGQAHALKLRAQPLWRVDGDRAEFITVSFWESRAAIESFACEDIEKAVLLSR